MKRILTIVALLALSFIGVQAAGTLAGTTINNSATLSYQVGGVNQTAVASNTDSFVVDNKVDFTVTHQDAAAVSVVPGQTGAVLKFVVTNKGNKTEDFALNALATTANPFGLTDNFNTTNVQVFVDVNGNGVYDPATDTATFIDQLAPDANKTVFIVSDIPINRVNGDVAAYALVAQVRDANTTGTLGAPLTNNAATADNALTEENVFADAAGTNDALHDGQHSDNDAYQVVTATLSVTKSSCVIWDPVNNATTPHRIPLAMIRYAIQVQNTGSATATGASLTDTLNAKLGYGASTAAGAPAAIAEVRNAACNCAAPAGTVVAGSSVSAAGQTVTANYGNVAAGATECAYFDTYIK